MWRDEIEQIARGVGFVPEYDPHLDVVVCTTAGQDYGLLVFQRSDRWYLSTPGSRFFHLRDASMLRELCGVLFQEQPSCATADDGSRPGVPAHIKLRFKLEDVEQERVEELLQPHLQGGLLYRDYLAKKFGFRGYSAGEEAVGMGLAEAKALVEQDRGHPIAFKVERVV